MNTTSALVMVGSLYNRPRNLKKQWTDHTPQLPFFWIKKGTYPAHCSPSRPAITASIRHSAEFAQKKYLYVFQSQSTEFSRFSEGPTLLSQPGKAVDGICCFASVTLSLDATLTCFTGKLIKYLNTNLDIKQFLLLGETDSTDKSQGVANLQ